MSILRNCVGLFGRFWFDMCKLDRRVDQPDMAERLREIAEHAPGAGIVFLASRPTSLRSASSRSNSARALAEPALQD